MYLPILFVAAVLWLLSGRGKVEAASTQDAKSLGSGFVALGAMAVATIVTITAATVTIHDGKISFHERFPTHEEVQESDS